MTNSKLVKIYFLLFFIKRCINDTELLVARTDRRRRVNRNERHRAYCPTVYYYSRSARARGARLSYII